MCCIGGRSRFEAQLGLAEADLQRLLLRCLCVVSGADDSPSRGLSRSVGMLNGLEEEGG
jgi:hypothetical protein